MRTNIFSASHAAKPEANRLIQAVFDQTSIGIAVFDTSNGVGVSANLAFSTLFNLALDVNKTWTLPQVFQLSGSQAEEWLTRARSNSVFSETVTLPREDEPTLALQVRIEPLAGHPNLATLMVQPYPVAPPTAEEPREAHTEAVHRLNEIETEYRLLIDSVSEVLCKIDRYGRWTFLNQAWTLITGYSPAQSLGKPVIQFIHADDRPAFERFVQAVLASKVSYSHIDLRFVTQTGAVRWLELYASPRQLSDTGGEITGSMIDITEKKLTDIALQRSEESIRGLYTVAASQHLNFSERIQALLVMGCQYFSMENGFLSRVSGNRFELQEFFSPGEYHYQKGHTYDLNRMYSQATLRAGAPLAIAFASREGWAEHPCYEDTHFEAYIGAPLIVSGETYGTLSFASHTPRSQAFTPAEKEFLRLISYWVGSEIERDRALRQLEDKAFEISQKNQALEEAHARAVEASRAKSEFLATMSHEFRTPMNAILGMTELLLDTPLSADQSEYVTILRDSGQVLLTLIEDILDFSKIEAGRLELERLDFNLPELVEGAVEIFVGKASEKGIDLLSYIDPAIPSIVGGDPTRLRQVLFNLIGNAVKFTDNGRVSVKVELVDETSTDVCARFIISDTGIGLSESDMKRLFQPFTQVQGSISRKYGGTGLGLVISKRLTEMMGGEVGVESEPGKGSRFWFTARFERKAVTSPEDNLQATGVLPAHALLIMPDGDHKKILAGYLAALHIDSVEIHAPTDTSSIFGENASVSDKVVFIETALPGWDSSYTLPAGVKKILIVSFNEISIGENALQHGFAGYLTKPLKQTQLINLLTGKKSETAQIRAGNETASPGSTAYPVRRNGTILLAEDHPTNRRLAILQLHKMGFNVDTVPDGRQAVERVLHGGKAYSLVLMDCRMPEMDGFDATRIIREAELTTGLHVPIVAMTANAVQGDREACLAAGMDDYISKPVRFEDLKKTLTRWYPEGASLALDEHGSATPTPTAGEAVLDAEVVAGIRSLQMDGEPDVMTMLVDIYLDDSLKTFEKIGPQLADNNPQLRQTLHALRGSSLNLGSRRFARLCAELETLAVAGNFDEVRKQIPTLTVAFEELRNALSAERQSGENEAEIR